MRLNWREHLGLRRPFSNKMTEQELLKQANFSGWVVISRHRKLPERFMDIHAEKLDWGSVSVYQKLSEKFIGKYADKVSWYHISIYQKLSEKFIEKYADRVDWRCISAYQKLSEKFVEKHGDKVAWSCISTCQKLSEKFIEKYNDKVDWVCISKYQKLSGNFLKKYNLQKAEDSWLYATKEEKLAYIRNNTSYEVVDDEYVVAYKSVRSDNYSFFNFQYKYVVGRKYKSHCDCNLEEENSFGLSAWTIKGALDHYNKGKLLKVKIPIEKIGAIVKNSNKIRCFELEVLREVKER